MAMSKERAIGRVKNLEAAYHRLTTRIAAAEKTAPKHPRLKIWRAKLHDVAQSLIRIRDTGDEKAPTGNPVGVKIGVPLGKFEKKALGPAGRA